MNYFDDSMMIDSYNYFDNDSQSLKMKSESY